VAIDRPRGEGVEQQRAADAPPPPPPPDTPGAEGFPSRAESKAFAASAADSNRRHEDTGDTPDTTPTPDAARDEQDASDEDRAQEPEASEHSEPETRENDAADSPYDTDHDGQDEGPEQPSSLEMAFPAGTVDNERTSVSTTAQTESVDHHAPYGDDTGISEPPAAVDPAAETAGDQQPDASGLRSDLPGAEPEEMPSHADHRAHADTAGTPDTDQTDKVSGSESPPDAGPPIAASESPASVGNEGVTEHPDLPTGEELLKMEGEETSKFDKFRKALTEAGPDVIDEIRQDTDTIDKILAREPPTGRPETTTAPDHPVMVPRGHDKASAGDLATGVFVAGLVLGQGISWILEKVEGGRGRRL
jgi:hypothetical protein